MLACRVWVLQAQPQRRPKSAGSCALLGAVRYAWAGSGRPIQAGRFKQSVMSRTRLAMCLINGPSCNMREAGRREFFARSRATKTGTFSNALASLISLELDSIQVLKKD